jgi:glycosyltransferase involved in cell wall biosynthesis
MSIQETINSKRKGSEYGLRLINRLSEVSQKTFRLVMSGKKKVFYPYRNLMHTHPLFLRYTKNSPLVYSNFFNAKLCHWVNFVPKGKQSIPYVIEPNDHPLAATGKSEPYAVLANIDKATEVYLDNNCKRILVESEGQLNLFKRYFSESVIAKTEIVRLGAMPRIVDFEDRIALIETPIFICLASDYKRKAVDLLIAAWKDSNAKYKCRLLLACPNVPEDIIHSLEKENIQLILKAPLSEIEKSELYRLAHVVIAPLHVDGGANVIEAFEFGLPVITMRSQRSFIREGNGWEINVPFYFYDEGYGKEWPTWNRFWELIDDAKRNNAFDMTVQGFVKVFDDIAKSPEILLTMGKVSHNLAKGDFSLESRNSTLRKIYFEALR